MSAAGELNYIGTRPIRPDGVEKVTGRANFGADQHLPGMLYGKVVRSPHAHARIQAIDTSAAEAMPGVLAVVTAADFPDRSKLSWRRKGFHDNLIASDKVLYHGHSRRRGRRCHQPASGGRRGRGSGGVDYEVLEAVTDILDALHEASPVLHDELYTEGLEETPEKPSNLVKKQTISKGDVPAAFEKADVIVERTFVTPMVHQGYIEPHACVGSFNEDGQATVWLCSSQGHFDVRSMTAMALGMDLGDIRVVPAEIGGGLRRQDHHLLGTAGREAVRKERPPSEDGDDARGRVSRHRPGFRHHQYRQGGRQPRRPHRRPVRQAPVRSRRLPGQSARRRFDVHVRAVRCRQRTHRRLRGGRQSAARGRLPRARCAASPCSLANAHSTNWRNS